MTPLEVAAAAVAVLIVVIVALAVWYLGDDSEDDFRAGTETGGEGPVDLPYMAPGSWHAASGPVPAFDLPAPNALTASVWHDRGGEPPEWVLRMLTGDLAVAVAADLQHCAHLAGAALNDQWPDRLREAS